VARIWHPWLRAPANQIEFRWAIQRSGPQKQAVSVNLRRPPSVASNY
jgi:hypothetical protein